MGSLYERYALPRLISCACGGKVFARQRRKVVPMAEGRVLEVGIGSGLNLPFYDPVRVESVTGVDPSAELRAMAEAAPRPDGLTVSVEAGAGERLPFADHSFDTLVCTYTLCSVGAVEAVPGVRSVVPIAFARANLAPDRATGSSSGTSTADGTSGSGGPDRRDRIGVTVGDPSELRTAVDPGFTARILSRGEILIEDGTTSESPVRATADGSPSGSAARHSER